MRSGRPADVPARSTHRAWFFDLDGTLIDTAPDMAAALNDVLEREGRDALELPLVRPHVSNGSLALIRLGFGDTIDDAGTRELCSAFLERYAVRLCDSTTIFAGMDSVLDALEQADLPWGIVTNKPGWLAEPLIEHLGLSSRARCIVSGDTLLFRKPHALPLLHAARQVGHDAAECIYVGDAERDIRSGRAAGMTTLIATYGYIPPQDEPENWLADGSVDKPEALLEWIT